MVKMNSKASALTLLMGLLSLLVSCTSETYDAGDGDLSYLRADFVEIHTEAAKTIDYFIDDDDATHRLPTPFAVGWAEKADTLYRALAYYNKVGSSVRPLSFHQVYVLRPQAPEVDGGKKTDPVGVESVWTSNNGRYFNIGLLLKTGQADSLDAIQQIGVLLDEETDEAVSLTLLHDQGGVPEYYTARVYASIPLDERLQGKAISLKINTYAGVIERTFPPV